MKSIERYAQEVSEKALVDTLAGPLKLAFEQGGFKGVSAKGQEILGKKITYSQAHERDFLTKRERLNREAGVVICNHPGEIDSLAVLGALDRDDVKLLAGNADRLRTFLPEDKVLLSTSDIGELRILMQEMREQVLSGGLVFLYPEGNQHEGPVQVFKSGFGALLKDLPPEAMVYSFNIESDKPQNESIVHVGESYAQAGDWIKAFSESGRPKSEYNAFLTEMYLSQFNKNH